MLIIRWIVRTSRFLAVFYELPCRIVEAAVCQANRDDVRMMPRIAPLKASCAQTSVVIKEEEITGRYQNEKEREKFSNRNQQWLAAMAHTYPLAFKTSESEGILKPYNSIYQEETDENVIQVPQICSVSGRSWRGSNIKDAVLEPLSSSAPWHQE